MFFTLSVLVWLGCGLTRINGDNREWSLLVPSWGVVLGISTYLTYSALAIRGTPAFDYMSAITGAFVLPLRVLFFGLIGRRSCRFTRRPAIG